MAASKHVNADDLGVSLLPRDVSVAGVSQSAQKSLSEYLARSSLPVTLKGRLQRDSLEGHPHYKRLGCIEELSVRPTNSSWCGYKVGCFCCKTTDLVPEGCVGLLMEYGEGVFLGAGYHSYASCGIEMNEYVNMKILDTEVRNGIRGFITISDGKIGVLQLGSDFKLLAPGSYEWSSVAVASVVAVDIRANEARLGPYTLITVPDGMVAVSYHHGNLRILGFTGADALEPDTARTAVEKESSRTFFMDDPNWVHRCFLSTQMQTDRLEGNDLLSKDNVEIVMVAMSQWRIVNPWLAITQCGADMQSIAVKVDLLIRATIARIVAGTCIGAGPVSGGLSQPLSVAVPVVTGRVASGAAAADGGSGGEGRQASAAAEEADLAHLMQSQQATKHMAELTHNLESMGIHVVGVYVPEKRIKNDDTRREVAKQAIIGIKAQAERSAADASAYATVRAAKAEGEAARSRADAKAYSTVTVAKADAEAIQELATAHTRAGAQLGAPTDTAARLALTEATSKVYEGAKVTIFSGAPSSMPFMLTGNP